MRFPLALAFVAVASLCASAAPDPIFDVAAITAVPLNPKVLKRSEQEGLVTEEVMFHAEDDGAKSVDIFALFVYPKGAVKAPAFVWNQGGLNKASPQIPELGARRGYATLCIDFPQPGYRSTGGYPINRDLVVGDDPRQAPIYHGAIALLQAVSYLQTRPEVDPDRIGMAGSSWGGFFTTLMAGIDPRLKVASAMFGTGSLQLGNAWWDDLGKPNRDAAERERWATTLDPALRLPASRVPIGWFTGTNDHFYWMPAMMRTYAQANEPKHLTLYPIWNHGLPPVGDELVFEWLDVHLKGAPAFPKLSPLKLESSPAGTTARWTYSGPRTIVSADLILSYGDDGNWERRCWITLPASCADGVCSASLPAGDIPYYIGGAVLDAHGFRYSTPLLRVSAADFAKEAPRQMLDYDGAAQWGGFEEAQMEYLKLNGWRTPFTLVEGKSGHGAAIAAGTAVKLPPVLFTAGIPHVLRFYAKSAAAGNVTVTLSQKLMNDTHAEQSTYPVGPEWKLVEVPFTPRAASVATLDISLTASVGAVIDEVSFRPAWVTASKSDR